MRHEWKGWLRLGVTLFLLYLAIHYWGALSHLTLLVLGTAAPLLLGAVIAYAVNILMSIYERVYWPGSTRAAVVKSRRPVCLLLAFASLVAIVILIIRMILPELMQSVTLLIQEVIPLLERLAHLLNQNINLEQILASSGVAFADGSINWREIITQAVNWLVAGLGGVMGSVVSLVSATISTAFTLVVSVIFSIYLLVGKEKLQRQGALVLRTYLKPSWYSRLTYFLQTLNTCFHRFIVGQCTEAVILGLLCIAGMLLFRFPYATMVGTLIGFTALIPVAGAYIGAGVGAFMIFTVSPIKALLFLLFISVLQQLEGNLIYPRVVGSSIGLPGIWVLAAVTIGGGLLGIFGMLLAVPLTATLYQILRADVKKRNPPPVPAPAVPQEDEPPQAPQ
ncbi:AI-2E family transporter [Pseudoflavonifractor sp. AF19-9AC]|uniref:AI-2E family transporter n=1 Tax=Pseudoflavonifractor sp. AF19-9AC TaxID=2292244 RepID=UPI000E4A9474|nr:AI-2E family transporter [Pseudoflavonifractor sp. AF19-9AC]RHR05691.1 AI-2E family transporter [Pseudoflavonifractor sp. AF19-9AC]